MLSRHTMGSITRFCCALLLMPCLMSTAQLFEQEIVSAHAFSVDELTAVPIPNRVTNGGNTYNQRFSPLTQILHFEGTLYISNGVNVVFNQQPEPEPDHAAHQ